MGKAGGGPSIPQKGEIDYSACGLDAYLDRHVGSYEDAKALETESNKFMGGFRVFEQKEMRKLKKLKHTEDEDGWTTIVPKIKSRNTATTQMVHGNTVDDYNKRQDEAGKKRAKTSTDTFSAFARNKKNMQRLIKMKKMLMKATDRKAKGASQGVKLRNFADRC
eukprot:Rhum_TRINITY_DN23264_c0_g1::Rhum_TRINITY_DN23264_c0_g1_i1::g.177552::m.177552